LKAAYDLIQGLNAAAKEVAVNQVKVDLTRHILEAQQALMAASSAQADAAQAIKNLEQRLMEFENWEAERKRYELADTGKGSVAYRLREGMEAGEPAHWLCPHCFEKRKKSIMKHETIPQGRANILVCHPCGLEVVTSGVRFDRQPSVQIPRGGGRRA
ncbi:MAG: hypothetical protein O9272_05905, partial [Brevundimonas sp.]|nr:hypothetical protein [Brevundimonas sp.]